MATNQEATPMVPIFGVGPKDGVGADVGLVHDVFDDFIFNGSGVGGPGSGSSSSSKTSGAKNGRVHAIDFDDESLDDMIDEDGKKRKRTRGQHRGMTEEQKIERRERNREHAKRSRVRKKFLLESLQHSVNALRGENEKLKASIREHLTDEAEDLLSEGGDKTGDRLTSGVHTVGAKTLDNPDFSLLKALQMAQQNFVITDPSMPDNPIVYASHGFLELTGYSLDQVLGRNCRFLQGPETDPRAVDQIRKGIESGEDTTVVLMNYRIDGAKFWNQFFVAALRDGEGNVVNYLGVQCKVSEEYAKAYLKDNEAQQ